jgi:putative membrane protein
MKRIAFSVLAAGVLLIGNACSRSDSIDRHNANTEEKQADQGALADAATESGYGAEAASPSAQADTSLFAVKAASSGMMEVSLGELAQQQGQQEGVKQFGQTMVADHGKANTELSTLARNKNMELPTTMLPQHQQHIAHLKNLSGPAFDKAYMTMMVQGHEKDVAEFQKAAQSEADPDLKAYAQKTLPVLKSHLDMARKTMSGLK